MISAFYVLSKKSLLTPRSWISFYGFPLYNLYNFSFYIWGHDPSVIDFLSVVGA